MDSGVVASASLSARLTGVLLMAAAWCCPGAQAADNAADNPADARQQAAKAAWAAAGKSLVRGPASVALKGQATLALPDHFGFVPQKEASALMSLMGNRTGENFLGLVFPARPKDSERPKGDSGDSADHWFISVQYDPAGYIKDDDAKHWDADKLLQSLKDGTEAANADRARAGIPPLMVTRWIEVPAYEAGTHRLVWSAEAKLKNGPDQDPTINYNTYLLGREGYVSLNLVTTTSAVDQDKAAARQLLAAVSFNSGKRYSDFNSSTDKVAAYGLAALVAGVAAKKLGLLALFAASAVKFAKVIAVAVAGIGAVVTKWFKARASRQSSQV